MDREYMNYHKVHRTFEINGINCEKSIGIDGQKPHIQNIYNEYCKTFEGVPNYDDNHKENQ